MSINCVHDSQISHNACCKCPWESLDMMMYKSLCKSWELPEPKVINYKHLRELNIRSINRGTSGMQFAT